MNQRLKFIIKVAGTVLALYLLLRQIDFSASLKHLTSSNPIFLLLALIAFNASQVISSVRLNNFFGRIGTYLSVNFNLKLYYIGMFYNLLLPGGIGGDGYKAYLLNSKFGTSFPSLVRAMVADRINGLMAIYLLVITMSLSLMPRLPDHPSWINWLLFLALPFGIYLYYRIFPSFRSILPATFGLSLSIQVLQMACVVALIYGLGIHQEYLPYLVIFLVSSVAAIIPITVGGLGLRELVFLYGAQLFGLNQEISVAISMLFFLITVLSSLIGLAIHYSLNERHWKGEGRQLP